MVRSFQQEEEASWSTLCPIAYIFVSHFVYLLRKVQNSSSTHWPPRGFYSSPSNVRFPPRLYDSLKFHRQIIQIDTVKCNSRLLKRPWKRLQRQTPCADVKVLCQWDWWVYEDGRAFRKTQNRLISHVSRGRIARLRRASRAFGDCLVVPAWQVSQKIWKRKVKASYSIAR